MTTTDSTARPATGNGATGSTEADGSVESTSIRGEALADRVRALLHEGNVHRIVVRDRDGTTVVEIPVTAAAAVAVLAPVVTGVAAFAALAADWRIDVHRHPGQHPTGILSSTTRRSEPPRTSAVGIGS